MFVADLSNDGDKLPAANLAKMSTFLFCQLVELLEADATQVSQFFQASKLSFPLLNNVRQSFTARGNSTVVWYWPHHRIKWVFEFRSQFVELLRQAVAAQQNVGNVINTEVAILPHFAVLLRLNFSVQQSDPRCRCWHLGRENGGIRLRFLASISISFAFVHQICRSLNFLMPFVTF